MALCNGQIDIMATIVREPVHAAQISVFFRAEIAFKKKRIIHTLTTYLTWIGGEDLNGIQNYIQDIGVLIIMHLTDMIETIQLLKDF